MTLRRILSIQSHVVRGYVGNRSAVFPLQLLGFEVDFINTVQFSNHTGYPLWKGQVLGCAEIEELYDGLKQNDVIHYDYVLTGYCRDKALLRKIVDLIKELKQRNPNLIYVCDPVMGDTWDGQGKMYVPEELLPIYRDEVIPIADILTPNQFEAELITELKITNEAEALESIQRLHERGPRTVVISSSDLGTPGESLIGYGSTTNATNGHKYMQIRLEMPLIGKSFVGSGDLFAALLLAWTHRHPDDLKLALEKVISTMQNVLQRTQKAAQDEAGESGVPSFKNLELRLIQSKEDIENPKLTVKSSVIAQSS